VLIREVKTKSGSIAVQIIYYKNRKRFIYMHVGSGKTVEEVEELRHSASLVIQSCSLQGSLFEDENSTLGINNNEYESIGIEYRWLYFALTSLQNKIGFMIDGSSMLNDLVTMRIVEPASKARSIELIQLYFGVKHRRQRFYESALNWLTLKDKIEQVAISFAEHKYGFDFQIVFYDVTTLYFETFKDDELRKTGFSKDSKSQQPQIVVALIVTKEGFPIGYEIFPGNTFEGHTFIPVIKSFAEKHNVQKLTVVADAAMISDDNVDKLVQANLNYIVGARLGNIGQELLNQIDTKLIREDGRMIRINTDKGYLICSYSKLRASKDEYEMNKQIDKAKGLIQTPSKIKKVKFVRQENQQVELNEPLIAKTRKLIGIKGYYTNLPETTMDNKTVVTRYHELYKIEQAFRIAKSDLQTRPIFHFKEEPIKLHMLICFMAMVVSKHIELQTKDSIRKFITEGKKATDVRLFNLITKQEIRIKARITPKLAQYKSVLDLPH
jgi:hypothetical protein